LTDKTLHLLELPHHLPKTKKKKEEARLPITRLKQEFQEIVPRKRD